MIMNLVIIMQIHKSTQVSVFCLFFFQINYQMNDQITKNFLNC